MENAVQSKLPHGCKACIALTSWKRRINTVGLTIYNLMCVCGPEFHIVLTLSEDEFPRKERELPKDLLLMNRAGIFEILWCKQNWKSLKKWLLCSARYPDSPIITADDDLLYLYDYASMLYNTLNINKCDVVSYAHSNMVTMCGAACCYRPNCFGSLGLQLINDSIIDINEDDMYYQWLIDKLGLVQLKIQTKSFPFIEHDAHDSLTAKRIKTPASERKAKYYKIFNKIYAEYVSKHNH